MKALISTHQGVLYDEEIDYIVVHNQDGEFAMLKDHVPVVCVINEGYVRFVLVQNLMVVYIYISQGILDFHDNFVRVLAQEAQAGYSLEEAYKGLHYARDERRKSNRRENVDFTTKEKEIRDNIKISKAGNL